MNIRYTTCVGVLCLSVWLGEVAAIPNCLGDDFAEQYGARQIICYSTFPRDF